MKKFKCFTTAFISISIAFSSCRKAAEIDYNDDMEANFTYVIHGDTAIFTNTSIGLSSYNWDFGDGTTSGETNPTHVYPGKGEYFIALTSGDAKANTILNIDKSSPIKMNDGTLDDWNEVDSTNLIISGADGGVCKKANFDYDANFVYIYIEYEGVVAENNIIDGYINVDNDNVTGYYPGPFTDLGADAHIEGQLPNEGDRFLDGYMHSGSDDHGSYDELVVNSISGEFWEMGTVIEEDGIVKYEFALDRNKFPGLKNESITLGLVILDSEYSDLGYFPDSGMPGFELNLNQ